MRWILLFLMLIPSGLAASGHMTLLTVAEGTELIGGTADVYLEVESGDGSIFIDSFPLTRLDTQGSTRYANQIACDFLQIDCSQYDFFYTIRAPSSVVGGPSAGAAIAVLTVAVLDGKPIDETVSMTGTINSGGIIGPVGGIPQKIAAAKKEGIGTVLVPLLSTLNETNVSADSNIVPQFSDSEVTVYRVATIEDALYYVTGSRYDRDLPEIVPPPAYGEIMLNIADDICRRTASLRAQIDEDAYEDVNNYSARISATSNDRPYTRASLCFSSNIELNRLVLADFSQSELRELLHEMSIDITILEEQLAERSIETITDLEVYAIVSERFLEAEQIVSEMNYSNVSAAQLAYAQERLLSAQIWSQFFELEGKPVEIDEDHLRRVCLSKLSEAEERVNYLRLYSDGLAATSENTLQNAYEFAKGQYIRCIFTASQAKAQANIVSSVLFLDEDNVGLLVQEKLRADDLVLRKQYEKGFFPVQGYSYMLYAQDLAEVQPYSALTFAEYALELSTLDSYFPQQRRKRLPPNAFEYFLLFTFGAIFGAAFATFVVKGPERTVRRKRRTGPSREKR